MKLGGITKRWTVNTLGVIVTLLVIAATVASAAFKNYYYNTVSTTLYSRASDVVLTFFNFYVSSSSESLYNGARKFVENSSDKDIMEIWVIDKDGKVIISSSGFVVDNNVKIPDYEIAAASKTGRGEWIGKLPSGEKVMALTTVLASPKSGNAGAVRYMISLEDIDRQLWTITLLIVLLCLTAIFLVIVSGLFFIQSIVKPIQNISVTAKRIAEGDLNARIDHYTRNDEIGELSETINNMAGELSKADKIKNDFISTISHELRTPLTAIKGWGETLLQVGDTDSALTQRGMSVIISEVSRLSIIVEELLDFSRMQSGRMNLRIEKIDVLAELDEAVYTFKEMAVREGIELIYNAPHLPTPMNADADRIRQVFLNILDNSLKYTQQGGRITVHAEIANANQLTISITDTGCGIPAEHLPRVKEKFFKINNSVKGSGIGLAVADEIIKLHGGKLEIDSILGEGTTATISFTIEEVLIEEERNPIDEE